MYLSLFLGSLFYSIDLCTHFYTNTILFCLIQLWNIALNQETWDLQYSSFSRLLLAACCMRLFSSSSVSAIRMVSSAYLRLLIFLLEILIPAVLLPVQNFS